MPKKQNSVFVPVIIGLGILVLAGVVIFSVRKGNFKNLKSNLSQLSSSAATQAGNSSEVKEEAKKTAAVKISKTLTAEERTILSKPFQVTIPRKITDDEEEILKKQVSFPGKLSEKPVIVAWKKDDFEKMISQEQKIRKIQLGYGYVKSLTRVFEKNYLGAVKSFDKGDYLSARDQFINSLAFPIYRSNPQMHRAVALVLLRPYLNDVIGKIAVLNQYLTGQMYLTDVNAIFSAYQAIFPVLELQEWDKALGMVRELNNQIKAFDQKPKDQSVVYPKSFALLDPEIQSAVQSEASPKPDAAVNLKALMVDLDLKEKVIEANTSEGLARVQKQYQQALSQIEQGNWEEADKLLKSITFPPELVEDVKTKSEIIEKILALNNSNQQQTKKQN